MRGRRHASAALAAQVLAGRGAADPEAAADELAAVLDGLVFTALLRGPHDPPALAAWMRPALARGSSPADPAPRRRPFAPR